MTNESIKALIGQTCLFGSATSSASGTAGKICAVEENWITIEDKKGVRELINVDYVTTILPQKPKEK